CRTDDAPAGHRRKDQGYGKHAHHGVVGAEKGHGISGERREDILQQGGEEENPESMVARVLNELIENLLDTHPERTSFRYLKPTRENDLALGENWGVLKVPVLGSYPLLMGGPHGRAKSSRRG